MFILQIDPYRRRTAQLIRTRTLLALLVLTGLGVMPATEVGAATPHQATSHSLTPAACGNARFTKDIALTGVLISEPPNDISHLGHAMAHRLGDMLAEHGPFHPIYLPATRSSTIRPTVDAFNRLGTPFFIRLSASNMSVNGTTSQFSFLGPSIDPRGATLAVQISNGSTASEVARFKVAARPSSTEQFDPPLDANSAQFWQSTYGRSLNAMLVKAANRIVAKLGCMPMIGTVLAINGDRIHTNIGANNGLKMGDRVLVIRRGDLLVRLGDTEPMQRQDYSLGVGRITGLAPGNAVIRFESDQTVRVGDFIWTGEVPSR